MTADLNLDLPGGSIGVDIHLGDTCTRCPTTESACARNYPCCEDCSHFDGDDEDLDFTPDRREAREPTHVHRSQWGNTACGTDNGWMRHRRARTEPCQPCRDAHNDYTYERRHGHPRNHQENPMTQPATNDLLTRARNINHKTVVAAVNRVDNAIENLRSAVGDYDNKAEARRDVTRLEAQLAEARAKLRGGGATPKRPVAGGQPCAKGCGRMIGTGRASHEASCPGKAA